MTIKHLYVNGDSFAFGQGIDDEPVTATNIYAFTENKKAFTYGGVISNALKIPQYTNRALPGGSNDRTFRTTMADLLQLKKTQNPEEMLVMIALTEASRTEFFTMTNRDFSPFLKNCEPRKTNRSVYHLWETYYAHFDHECEQTQRLFTGMIGLQSFLQLHKFNYIFTESIRMFDNNTTFKNNEMYQAIDTSRYYDCSFNSFGHHNDFVFSPCHHPKRDAHAAWASRLISIMMERGIC